MVNSSAQRSGQKVQHAWNSHFCIFSANRINATPGPLYPQQEKKIQNLYIIRDKTIQDNNSS